MGLTGNELCKHGGDGSQERIDVILQYQKRRCDLVDSMKEKNKEMGAHPFADVADEVKKLRHVYWKLHSGLIDNVSVKTAYALATQEALKGDLKSARGYVLTGIVLEYYVSRGGYVEQCLSPCCLSDNCYDAIVKSNLIKAWTCRGALLFVADKLSCSCLDAKKAEAVKAPATDRCLWCDEEKVEDEILICGGCKICRYCSKKCQKRDWRYGHKAECNKLAAQTKVTDLMTEY